MKKRIMGIALAAVMGVVSMTGCGSGSDSKKDSTKVKVQTTLTDNGLWDDEMLVDGKVLKAPITSKTLNALGYEVSDNDKSNGDIDTEGVYMYAMNCVNKDTGVTIGTSALINNGNKTMDYASSFGSKDLEFYKLMFSGGDNEENDYNFEITKGITIGSTEDDVKNAFGEPDYVTYYDAYMYFENPNAVSDKSEPDCRESGYASFNFSDGKVSAITLSAKMNREISQQ